ncbi:MAG: IS1634 family transposase [Actinomycetota bacterium]|nr:IS1634 family transposase [Actinomycetota bacterium]
MHVVTTRRQYKDKVYETTLLRLSYREGGKVKNETLANLSHLRAETIEVIRASLAGKALVEAGADFDIERSLPHGHVAATWAMANKLGLAKLLGPACGERDLAIALIVARAVAPGSKLATTRWWASTTLASDLGVAGAGTDEVYDAMDWLVARQGLIEAGLARRHLAPGGRVLYDLSSSWVEGTHCPLAVRGHSRDNKTGKDQIEYGLTCCPEGRPVAVEVFAGNTADPSAFISAAEVVRARFGLSDVVMVGDRGMITQARIDALRKHSSLGWISALRAPAIAALASAGALQMSLFDEVNLAEITHPDFPDERLVACRNPALAASRAAKRDALLAATEADLEVIKAACCRARRPLRGADKIGLRVGKVINGHKMAKHFELDITDETFSWSRKTEAITAEAALDGIYVVRASSAHNTGLDAPGLVGAYKDLKFNEAGFRSLKTIDLDLRPIHHWTENRVRAHVLICMLALYVVWHLRRAWAPICFTDEDRPPRTDPVAPATRSPQALTKASRRHDDNGQPVHSFPTLLAELGTLTRNTIVFTGGIRITKLATPTPLQHRAFELIGAPIPTQLRTK